MPRWRNQLDPAKWAPVHTSVNVAGCEITAQADYTGPADGDWGKPQREYVDSLHDWHEFTATSWRVTLAYGAQSFTLPFYQGSAHRKPPTAATVLDCVLSDADAGEMDFEEFAGDFGYDVDSRKAEATWKACRETALQVRMLLGNRYQAVQNVRDNLGEIPDLASS